MNKALLLNASREPLAIIRDRDAVELYMEQLAYPIEYSGEIFHSPSVNILVPSVLALHQYVVMPEKHRSIMLTRRNVCARDNNICGYCGKPAGTIDHIKPRSRGGTNTWENVTAACEKCNGIKGHRTLAEMREQNPTEADRWTLHRKPYRPKGVAAHLLKIQPDACWLPYLQVESPVEHASETVSMSAP